MPPDPDPLLAFSAEPAEVDSSNSAQPVPRVETAENAESPTKSAPEDVPAEEPRAPAPSAEAVDVHRDLRERVERAEQLLERSLVEMTTIKSALATLVSAFDDMKKRQSSLTAPRVPARHAARRTSRLRASAAAAAVLIFAVLGWGLTDFASDELTVPLTGEPDAAEPVTAPHPVSAPVVSAVTPPVEIQQAASVTPAARRENAAPSRAVVAREDPRPRPASRAATGYVGTLTVDASPAGEVFVDRRSVGRTPVRLENLRAGSHLVWIERDGYRRWTRVVAVAANRVSRVSADLDPISR